MANVKDVVDKLSAGLPKGEEAETKIYKRKEYSRVSRTEYMIIQSCRPNGSRLDQRIYQRFSKVL